MHASICDTLSDLVQNALEAGATRVELDVYTGPDRIEVRVADNGKGMSEAEAARAFDPFYSEAGKHAGRRVGLGLPLAAQTAEAAGGGLSLRSRPGEGTEVCVSLDAAHLDAPPLGDLPATVVGLMAFEGGYDLAFTRRTPAGGYAVSRRELSGALGGLREAACLTLAKAYLQSQEASLETEMKGTEPWQS